MKGFAGVPTSPWLVKLGEGKTLPPKFDVGLDIFVLPAQTGTLIRRWLIIIVGCVDSLGDSFSRIWIYLFCPLEREVRSSLLVALFGWGFLDKYLPGPTTSFEVT